MEYAGLPKLPDIGPEGERTARELAADILTRYPSPDACRSVAAQRLGYRVARYYKLLEINAPDTIVAAEARLIARALRTAALIEVAIAGERPDDPPPLRIAR